MNIPMMFLSCLYLFEPLLYLHHLTSLSYIFPILVLTVISVFLFYIFPVFLIFFLFSLDLHQFLAEISYKT